MSPPLSIAIPTFNRSKYLKVCLENIISQSDSDRIEILVSDNCSTDRTEIEVKQLQKIAPNLSYIKNSKNMGWGYNFTRALNTAQANYVLVVGDDDILLPGSIQLLLDIIESKKPKEFGLCLLSAYGFDDDYLLEHPGPKKGIKVYFDINKFILQICYKATLISGCLINKKLLKIEQKILDVYPNLPLFYYALKAATQYKINIQVYSYCIAGKRNNSQEYDFGKIFVCEYLEIVKRVINEAGLSNNLIEEVKNKTLIEYYPLYFYQLLKTRSKYLNSTLNQMLIYYGSNKLFNILYKGIFIYPFFLSIILASVLTLFGRIMAGDLKRGIMYLKNKMSRGKYA